MDSRRCAGCARDGRARSQWSETINHENNAHSLQLSRITFPRSFGIALNLPVRRHFARYYRVAHNSSHPNCRQFCTGMSSCLITTVFAVGGPSGPSKIPLGHTRESWQSAAMHRPIGHTAYSWLHAAHDPATASKASDPTSRLESAELRSARVRTNMKACDSGVARVKAALEQRQVKGAVLWEVASAYYSWELPERA